MDNQGIMDRLDEMMKNVDSDPMMAFLLPGVCVCVCMHVCCVLQRQNTVTLENIK